MSRRCNYTFTVNSGARRLTTIRFDPVIKKALARAAQSHHRSSASMLHEILREWLTAKHFYEERR